MRLIAGFAGVGVAATLCHILILNLVGSLTPAPLAIANLLAYLAASLITFVGNALISFRRPVTLASGLRFALVSAVILVVDQVYLEVLRTLGAPLWISSWGLAILNPALNFLFLRFFVFIGPR
ncbi:MAG: GtrA family protein [Phenylobacterium sp.]|nr:GtrA family protein [Phenylobacterium sp.]MCA6306676.1 GtrA family protein [Phenylobacterium sp.]